MKQKMMATERRHGRQVVALGRACVLTRAESSGNHLELIGDRLYTVGG